MPDSMFGRPSQHLLPSRSQTNAEGSSGASNSLTAPVQLAPLPFKDFRFSAIGKQPELLSRISFPQPDNAEYRSPTPSPLSTPPAFAGDFPKTTSRPTLLQQLGSGDSSSSTSQLAVSLASRIQMSGSPSTNITNTAHGPASTVPPLLPSHIGTARRATEDNNLIPPVEVLPQSPATSPTTLVSWIPPLDQGGVHSPAFSTPLINTAAIVASRIPAPSVATTSITPRDPTEPGSSAHMDATMQDLQQSLSTTATIDSLLAQQDRLQSISAKLANLAAPLPPPSPQSPPLDTSSVTSANASITSVQRNQSQPNPTPVVLHHPYPTTSSGQVELCADDVQTHQTVSSLALIPSPVALTQEYHSQSKALVAAIENLNSVLRAAQRTHADNENNLVLRTRTFEEQRAAFEQTKRVEEDTLRREFHELQVKREELHAKEALFASLEKENKTREEARKGVFAKRQAQEEEKRAAEAKRVQEVQEQITNAMDELKELGALKAKCQVFQLASETLGDGVPTEPLGGMNEEEVAAIKSRNDLLCALKHLRRMHTDKIQKLEQVNLTLHKLGEERKKREVEEADRRRIAEENHVRAHAETERARRLQDKIPPQVEAERKRQERQEVEKDHDQAQLLVQHRAHAEAQANGLGRVHAINTQMLTHPTRPEHANASQHQELLDAPRIHVACNDDSSPGATNAMNVDEDGRDSAHTAPSCDTQTNPCALQSKQKKKDKPISGGVMLAAPTTKSSDGHLTPKLLVTPPSLSSGHVDAPKTPVISPAVSLPSDGGRRASFPAQPASESTRADFRPTLDHKSAFSRTLKSRTILESTSGANQELNINIGPLAGVSPTQQNVNLRHLKRFRGRIEGSDSDRSVRMISVKSEENSNVLVKKEDYEEIAPGSASTNLPASLPPRPAIIPPPRPRMFSKRSEAPAAQANSSSHPPKSNGLSLRRRGAEVTVDELPQEAHSRDVANSQAPVQPLAPSEATNSLLLGPVYTESRAPARINTLERPARDQGENGGTTPSESASAALSHEWEGEDLSRSTRRFTDERHRSRNTNGPRRVPDRYSPPSITSRSNVTSPTQSHRPIDSWRQQNPSNGPRAEPTRATSPTTGRKRPLEFSDNDHSHRARRQRGDVWTAQDHDRDRDRVDSYHSQRDRGLDSESDQRHAAYRVPGSPTDRTRPYPLDTSRTTYDNRPYPSEEATSPAARWEQSHRRTENDGTYHRYQPSAPVYNAMADQHHADGVWVGQTYEPMTEESTETQPHLLARIHDTQRFPHRGRGRGETSRGRGDSGRGRGRGIARGGTPLLERLTSCPASTSLEDRLTY